MDESRFLFAKTKFLIAKGKRLVEKGEFVVAGRQFLVADAKFLFANGFLLFARRRFSQARYKIVLKQARRSMAESFRTSRDGLACCGERFRRMRNDSYGDKPQISGRRAELAAGLLFPLPLPNEGQLKERR